MRNHTATHLLHRALRNVVGPEAHQAGSLVAPDYLRFDYPLDRRADADEKRAIEDEVRRIVRENRPVTTMVQPMADAIAAGADAFFDEKYGERVRTVRVEGYSLELCGGTHCSASGQIGGFVITADRSIGAGTRRIEAVTGDGADALLRERTGPAGANRRRGRRHLRRGGSRARGGSAGRAARDAPPARGRAAAACPRPPTWPRRPKEVAPGVKLVAHAQAFESSEQWKGFVKEIRAALGSGVIAVAFDAEAPQIFVTVSPDLVERGISAGELVKVAMTSRWRAAAAAGRRWLRVWEPVGTGSLAAMAAIADTLGRAGHSPQLGERPWRSGGGSGAGKRDRL